MHFNLPVVSCDKWLVFTLCKVSYLNFKAAFLYFDNSVLPYCNKEKPKQTLLPEKIYSGKLIIHLCRLLAINQ